MDPYPKQFPLHLARDNATDYFHIISNILSLRKHSGVEEVNLKIEIIKLFGTVYLQDTSIGNRMKIHVLLNRISSQMQWDWLRIRACISRLKGYPSPEHNAFHTLR